MTELNYLGHPRCPHGGWCGMTGDETGPELCEGFSGCNYFLEGEEEPQEEYESQRPEDLPKPQPAIPLETDWEDPT